MLIQDVNKYIEPYVSLDMPVEYKELKIKPILMKDIFTFLYVSDILTIEKNKIPDVDVIQMSYLDFIVKKLLLDSTSIDADNEVTQGGLWKYKLSKIIELCLDAELSNVDFICENNKFKLKINNIIIDSKDFDEIKRIILYQNFYDFDDTPMSDDFKKVVDDYYKLKYKRIKMPSIEDKKDVIMFKTSYTSEQISNMTYRRFERLFYKIVAEDDYMVGAMFKTAGNKEPLEHWVYKDKKNRYSEIFSDSDAFKDRFNHA